MGREVSKAIGLYSTDCWGWVGRGSCEGCRTSVELVVYSCWVAMGVSRLSALNVLSNVIRASHCICITHAAYLTYIMHQV